MTKLGQKLVDQWSSAKNQQNFYSDNSWYMPIPILTDFGYLYKFYLTISTGSRDFPITINGWDVDLTNLRLRFIIFNNSTYITSSNIGTNLFNARFLIIDTIS